MSLGYSRSNSCGRGVYASGRRYRSSQSQPPTSCRTTLRPSATRPLHRQQNQGHIGRPDIHVTQRHRLGREWGWRWSRTWPICPSVVWTSKGSAGWRHPGWAAAVRKASAWVQRRSRVGDRWGQTVLGLSSDAAQPAEERLGGASMNGSVLHRRGGPGPRPLAGTAPVLGSTARGSHCGSASRAASAVGRVAEMAC